MPCYAVSNRYKTLLDFFFISVPHILGFIMPSETMDFKSSSSPLYSSEDIWSSNERQAGFWKSDNVPNYYDSDQGTRSSLNVRPRPVSNLFESSNVNMIATQHESSLFSSSLSELFSRKLRLSANNALYGHSVDTAASHCEEEGLLESLEELEAQTIGNLLPNDDDLLSGLTDGVDHIIQDNASEEMEELDLFSSVGGMDLGNDSSFEQRDSQLLDETCSSQLGVRNGSFAGEHPSRTLFVRNIDSDVKDSELKALFEQFGDIHTLDTACKHHGFVAISYYDIRATENAIRVLQNRLYSCRKFEIHYSIPKENLSEEDINEGTLVVFDHDSSVSNDELHHIFNVYGEIKEIRDNPQNRHHKFIDFFDVRAAKAALHAINGNESNDIAGKRIKVERSQPGASKWCMVQQIPPELEQKECGLYLHPNSPPLKSPTSFPGPDLHGVIKSGSVGGGRILGVEPAMHASSLETAFNHGISSSVPNTLPSLVRLKSVGNQCGITKSSSLGQLNFDIQSASAFHPHSLPEFHDGLANVVHHCPPDVAANVNLKTQERIDNMQFCRVNSNGNSMEFNECVFKSSGNGSCCLPGHHYKCSNSYKASGMMWPNSPPYFDGICAAPTLPKLHGLPRSPLNMMSTVLPINNQHVPSAPGFNSPLWGTQHTYAGESPEASSFHHGSLGNMRFSSNTPHRVDFVSHNIFPHFGGNCVDFPFPPKNFGLQFRNQRGLMFPRRNHLIPLINPFDTHKERARSRRNEGGSSLADKKQYELDIDRIKRGEDDRTTLMIKNIPNKYTSKMLLAAIDERHKGAYDFIYLPIDFKNKCNMGYAFINMTDPNVIIPFYQVFNGKKWEKFNSEKVASLAYARIQGKAALIAHFQNSSLMNEDKRCRPILFKTDGPNAGDQVPFPTGVNIHNKPGRMRNNTQEDSLQGSPPNLGNGELSSGRDTFFSKESN